MCYFVGLDVALRPLALCVIDSDGKIVVERALDCEVEVVDECLAKFGHPIQKVGFEAGTVSQTLFYGLHAIGYDVVCMEARHVSAALSAMRIRQTKMMRAQIVRSGWYLPAHMKNREAHYIRALLSSRKAVLRKCVDLENEIHGLFKAVGIRLPAPLSRAKFEDTVRPIMESDEGLAFALLPMLNARRGLYIHYRDSINA